MEKYQDYVIKDGKFIGKFEEMYQKCKDPWHQEEMFSDRFFYKRLVVNFLGLRKIRINSMLDLGCGKGVYTKYLKEGLGIPNVIGLEISPTAVKEARKRYEDIRFEVSNLSDIKELKQRFDLVVMASLFWYVLPNIKELLKDIKAAMNENGHLLVIQHFHAKGEQKYGNETAETYEQYLDVFTKNGFKIDYTLEGTRFSDHNTVTLFSL